MAIRRDLIAHGSPQHPVILDQQHPHEPDPISHSLLA
jgi:hypothetical protein